MDSSVIFWHNIKQSIFASFKKLIKRTCSHWTNAVLGWYAKYVGLTQFATQGPKFKKSMPDQSDWRGRIHVVGASSMTDESVYSFKQTLMVHNV